VLGIIVNAIFLIFKSHEVETGMLDESMASAD
jgi:hypothetical protein